MSHWPLISDKDVVRVALGRTRVMTARSIFPTCQENGPLGRGMLSQATHELTIGIGLVARERDRRPCLACKSP